VGECVENFKVGQLVAFKPGFHQNEGDTCLEEIVWRVTKIGVAGLHHLAPVWAPDDFELHESWGPQSWVDISDTADRESLQEPDEMLVIAISALHPHERRCHGCIRLRRRLDFAKKQLAAAKEALDYCFRTARSTLEKVTEVRI
jgi:hypothetical protein